MFTGIVEEVGTLVVREDQSDSAVLQIQAQRVLDGVALGDSIAVNGVCLTVTRVDGDVWTTDVMAETLSRSSLGTVTAGAPVNLERAVTPHTRLGGHMMQGHALQHPVGADLQDGRVGLVLADDEGAHLFDDAGEHLNSFRPCVRCPQCDGSGGGGVAHPRPAG